MNVEGNDLIQCYVTVTEGGDILDMQQGKNIIPYGEVDYFFWTEGHIDPDAYRVEVENMKPRLVLK